tara:strand:- start:905 stop:1372 length:468 start_codon:yes stop_codon:yes gene_type:complete
MWPKDRFNPLHFFIGWLLLTIILTWFHEFGHITTVLAMGGSATVRPIFSGLPVFVTDIDSAWLFSIPLWKQSLITLMGGWTVAASCIYLWATSTDIDNRIIFHALGWSQFAEGALEAITWMNGNYHTVFATNLKIAAILGMTIFALARSRKMWNP